jgi:hypothetical protein
MPRKGELDARRSAEAQRGAQWEVKCAGVMTKVDYCCAFASLHSILHPHRQVKQHADNPRRRDACNDFRPGARQERTDDADEGKASRAEGLRAWG